MTRRTRLPPPSKLELDRRQLLAGLSAAAFTGASGANRALGTEISADTSLADAEAAAHPKLGPAKPFSFDALIEDAKQAASRGFEPPQTANAEVLKQITYDAYQQIKYRRDRSLALDAAGNAPVQFFHLGVHAQNAVPMHVVENGSARPILPSQDLFLIPDDHPARDLDNAPGLAGFRVMAPDQKTDWLAFVSASYFRASGPFNQYGLSARGLAIDIGLADREEFPRFSEFWLKKNEHDDQHITIYARLDSPGVTGAYRIVADRKTIATPRSHADRQTPVTTEVECVLFARHSIERLGIAPFSSMFWYGETDRRQAADWRPEIHDSDGLAIETGTGERIWRPLNNPKTTTTSAFLDENVRGFGLMQRDRDFVHYLDDSVFYERRPSAWIEPLATFGKGAVHLLEIPTDDEIHDNIAAYWCPDGPFERGTSRRYHYRIHWCDRAPMPGNLARTIATWSGMGGRPGFKRPAGLRKFVIDFEGQAFDGLDRRSGVELTITPSRGSVRNAYTHPVVNQPGRWRAVFDLDVTGTDPIDIKAHLHKEGTQLTENWVYQYAPDVS